MRRLEARVAELEAAYPDKGDSPWDWAKINCEELEFLDTNWERFRARDIT